MDRGRPAARHQKRVAGDRPHAARMPGEAHGLDALAAANLVHRGFRRHAKPGRPRRLRQRPRRVVAQIGDQFDLGARVLEIERGAIGAVMRGHHDDALADPDAVLMEIAPRGVGEHHARPIVVGEDERALDRAGRQHDFARPHLPQPLAREIGIRDQLGLRDPLAQARRNSARSSRRLACAASAARSAGERSAANVSASQSRALLVADPRAGLGKKRAAGGRVFVADDDPGAAGARGQSRGESRRSRADDQDVAMIKVADISVGIRLAGRVAEARREADRPARRGASTPSSCRTSPGP